MILPICFILTALEPLTDNEKVSSPNILGLIMIKISEMFT